MKKFLLLCGVATIAVASVALAEDPAPVTAATYTNRATATLTADIHIFSPITMTDGELHFPFITTTNMNNYTSLKVKVNPDGSIDYGESTAQIIDDGEAYVNPIKIFGGTLGVPRADYTAEGADDDALDADYSNGLRFYDVHTVEIAETIPMFVEGSSTPCGEVESLVPSWHYDTSLNGNKGGLKLSFGGTFTLGNLDLADGNAYCIGSTTVTYIMDN